MKCVADVDCQAVLDTGNVKFFQRGEGGEFKECPPHFSIVDDGPINFETASKFELLEAKWTVKEAKDAVKDLYGVTLTFPKNTSKQKIVEKILDARFRSV